MTFSGKVKIILLFLLILVYNVNGGDFVARKKKIVEPDYTGIGSRPDNAIVQKSKPLFALTESSLTLPELKILDVFLSRINSHDPEKTSVMFERGELERILNVTKLNEKDLDLRLKHLFTSVKIQDDEEPRGFVRIGLMERAEAKQDENGQWQVLLKCTEDAKEYIFNIENLGYLKYRLALVVNLTSRYSYTLVLYLLDNRYRESWIIDLGEIKKILGCTSESYQQFKVFNDRVLKICKQEIESKTDLRFEYEPVKTGRKVTKIKFSVKTNQQITVDDIMTLEGKTDDPDPDEEDLMIEKYGSKRLADLAANCDYEFTREEMEIISALLNETVLPFSSSSSGIEELQRWDYLDKKYKEFLIAVKKYNVKRRFEYFKKMLEKARSDA